MHYLAEFPWPAVVFFIYWIVSSIFKDKNKKKDNDNVLSENVFDDKSNFDFKILQNLNIKSVKNIIDQYKNNIDDTKIELENDSILEKENIEKSNFDNEYSNVTEQDDELINSFNDIDSIEPLKNNKINFPINDLNELQRAIIMKEIIDIPISKRKFFNK